MKKTQKKICGLLGLALVVTMTIIAAFLPGPGATAATSTETSDTITVTVIDSIPYATITNPKSGDEIVSLDTPINIDYRNMEHYILM